MRPASAKQPKLTQPTKPLDPKLKSAAAVQFLDDDRVVVALLGNISGGERCSIVSLSRGKETIIDPDLYAQGNPGMLAFDANRHRILFAMSSDVTLFDAKTGKAVARFGTGGRSAIEFAWFSPDGAFACVGTHKQIDLWDTRSDRPDPVVDRHSKDMPNGKRVHSFKPAKPSVGGRFSADGALLATSTSSLEDGGGALELRTTKDWQLVATATWPDPIAAFDFAPDGRSMFVALTTARVKFGKRSTGDGQVHVVDLRGQTIRSWKPEREFFDLRCLASGLLVTIDNKSLELVDPTSGDVVARRAQKTSFFAPRIADVRGNRILTVGPMAMFTVE